MKVLVTGGAGFIGSHIVDTLISKGHTPFVVDNLTSGSRKNLPSEVPLFEVDICDSPQLARVFDTVGPDCVCHQAAQMSVSRSMREPLFDAEVNIMGLLNVFDHSARVGVKRIVFASSGGVLYGEVTQPAVEDCPKCPLSPYGISKWVGEQYLEFYTRERNIQGIALRYSNIYGPRQNPHGEAGVVAIFSKAMLSGNVPTINGDGKYVRDYVFGPDVACASVAAMEVTLPAKFVAVNIGSGIGVDVNEIAVNLAQSTERYFRTHGIKREVPECRHGEPRPGDLRSSVVSPKLASELLNWQLTVKLHDGIQQTLEWFAAQESIHELHR